MRFETGSTDDPLAAALLAHDVTITVMTSLVAVRSVMTERMQVFMGERSKLATAVNACDVAVLNTWDMTM